MLVGLLLAVGAFLLGLGIGLVQGNPQGWTYIIGGALLVLFAAWMTDRGRPRSVIYDKEGVPKAKVRKKVIRVRRSA